MSYQLTNSTGTVEAVIDDNCGMKKFYSVADMLAKELNVKFTGKHDNFDSTDWEFRYKGRSLRLHYNIYNGVSICTLVSSDNDVVTELASLLEKRFY
jgi:hypothetical protein